MFVEKNRSTWNLLTARLSVAQRPITFETTSPPAVRLVGNELKAIGSLDRSNTLELIDKGQRAYEKGLGNLVINLAQVEEISLAGLFGLYSLVMIFRGEKPPAYADGHSALAQMKRDMEAGVFSSAVVFKNVSARHEEQLALLGY